MPGHRFDVERVAVRDGENFPPVHREIYRRQGIVIEAVIDELRGASQEVNIFWRIGKSGISTFTLCAAVICKAVINGFSIGNERESELRGELPGWVLRSILYV
jgi:hypothetical protein